VATEAVPAVVKEAVAMVHPIAGSKCGAARRRRGRGRGQKHGSSEFTIFVS